MSCETPSRRRRRRRRRQRSRQLLTLIHTHPAHAPRDSRKRNTVRPSGSVVCTRRNPPPGHQRPLRYNLSALNLSHQKLSRQGALLLACLIYNKITLLRPRYNQPPYLFRSLTSTSVLINDDWCSSRHQFARKIIDIRRHLYPHTIRRKRLSQLLIFIVLRCITSHHIQCLRKETLAYLLLIPGIVEDS
ncbi:hypothetical protein P171DRAFT_117754 [Karstenula rhodostoma CBS 690.94]|uniref:Uncharacterized protein n=1 Tax=Karstenula rhodostoma CBS 690.94 TaxID=1392251 RepID=A0A9P4P9P0_9PLEO|nr:hypothetical protein P171DRAFT_117754 [Karstenula rhodostoma CBS 690.94]